MLQVGGLRQGPDKNQGLSGQRQGLVCMWEDYSCQASDSNRKRCEAYCEEDKACHKCSKLPACGEGYKSLATFKGSGKNWYACRKNPHGIRSEANKKECMVESCSGSIDIREKTMQLIPTKGMIKAIGIKLKHTCRLTRKLNSVTAFAPSVQKSIIPGSIK